MSHATVTCACVCLPEWQFLHPGVTSHQPFIFRVQTQCVLCTCIQRMNRRVSGFPELRDTSVCLAPISLTPDCHRRGVEEKQAPGSCPRDVACGLVPHCHDSCSGVKCPKAVAAPSPPLTPEGCTAWEEEEPHSSHKAVMHYKFRHQAGRL